MKYINLFIINIFICLCWIIWTPDTYGQETVDYAYPKEYTIAEISVRGAKYLDANAITSISGLKVGDIIKVPSDEISQAIRNLWKQGILGDIKINILNIVGGDIFIEIEVKERPRLSDYRISGVRKGQITTLNDKVGILRGRIISNSLIQNAKNSIKIHYKDKGYKNIEVFTQVENDTFHKNHNILNIRVKKNQKVRIKDIHIEGISAFKKSKILKQLKKTKQKKFTKLFKPSRFIRYEYWNDKDNLITFYKNKGYRDAKIVEDTIIDISNNRVSIHMKIEEGNRFYYGNITWTGNFTYDDKTLNTIFGIKRGDIYNPKELEKRLTFNPSNADVTSIYMDNGYLFFSLSPIEKNVRGDTIDLELRVYEGEQANINTVFVNGNTRTNDHVIYRELRTYPGYKFSRSNLIRTQRELATLGYFDPEAIDIQPQPNPATGTVDIQYGLSEKSNDQLELSAGWGGQLGFIGTVGVSFNNFSSKKLFKFREHGILPTGDGQKISLRIQANGRRYQNYSISFTEPWLGGNKPNNFNISLNYTNNRSFDNGFTRPETGRLDIISFSLGLAKRLTKPDDFFSLSNSLSYSFYNLTNFRGFGLIGFGDFSNGNYHNFNLVSILSRNSVDNFTFPRQGSSLSLQATLTPPYSLFENTVYAESTDQERFRFVEYAKFLFDSFWYLNIVDKLVLNVRFHTGLITPYSIAKGIGPFERFQLGGDGLTQNNFFIGTDVIGLRGYSNNSIIPIDEETQNQIGGVAFAKYVLELRYPVTLSPSATIYVLSFVEAGNNWSQLDQINPFNLYRSAGIGARFLLPAFGLLGIDFARGFNEVIGNPEANKPQLHFTIGQTIR